MKTRPSSGVIALSAITLVTVVMILSGSPVHEAGYTELTVGHLSDDIARLDESLTMSVRMCAATGDLSWADRYYHLRSQLDVALKELIALSPSVAAAYDRAAVYTGANVLDLGNAALVGVEKRAIDLVRQGHKEEAAALLRSATYEEQKRYYADGIAAATTAVRADIDARFRRLHGHRTTLLALTGSALVLLMTSGVALLVRRRAYAETLKLAQIVEQSPVVLMVTDTDGHIEYVNSTFTEVTGFTADQVIGKTPRVLKSGHTSPEQYEELWATIRSGRPWSGELRNMKRCGGSYWAAATISPLEDNDGRITGFVGMQTDTTKRKQAEEERGRLEIELRHAHKMEAIGLLAGGIAHDFNNMLSVILGSAELALAKVTEEGRLRGNLQRIVEASDRAKDLVSKILTFSRQNDCEPEPVEFAEVVREALGLIGAALPAMIEIHDDIDSDCGLVLADRTHLHQVVMNLCTNASHAMSEAGGVLEVSLRRADVDAALADTDGKLREGQYVKLTVADTGHGMDEATQDRIFDPFFTTKPVDEGTGMGLSVIHGIVAEADGTIMVRSVVGEGTIFEVYFPVCGRARSSDGAQEARHSVEGSGSVLLVDDEAAVVETAAEMLEELGYKVTVLDSSIEAMEVFRDHPDCFDVVITDQAMPRMSGVALAKVMKSIRADIPIIIATGYSDVVSPNEAREHGFCCYVAKPYGARTLSVAVGEALKGRGVVAESANGA